MDKKVVSLFSGIGGLDKGFSERGYETTLFCEASVAARSVLSKHFPDAQIELDIKNMNKLPVADIVTAGFPCQDLSQAGRKAGIGGGESGLVSNLFRLLDASGPARPKTIVVENVPYMLRLNKGEALLALIKAFEELGYSWAYRTVDARAFGVPQRRPRVVMLASKTIDPKSVLFSGDEEPYADPRPSDVNLDAWYGFYWTEGSRGVGWTHEGVPPIKGGSGLGIPSAPAIWIPKLDFVGTPTIEDAERLQGFPAGWTSPAVSSQSQRKNIRWSLIGNAVVPHVSDWLAERIDNAEPLQIEAEEIFSPPLPAAAYGGSGKFYKVRCGPFPVRNRHPKLRHYLRSDLKPLSPKATTGFLRRTAVCTNVNYAPKFIQSLRRHIDLYPLRYAAYAA